MKIERAPPRHGLSWAGLVGLVVSPVGCHEPGTLPATSWSTSRIEPSALRANNDRGASLPAADGCSFALGL
jgi:hypothetical protein